ncbi:MAG: glycosyltransferase family 2 protein [Candidatus Kapaibacterium sp.]
MSAQDQYMLPPADRKLMQEYGWEFGNVPAPVVRSSAAPSNSLPLITVGILSYNRCDDLLRTLHTVIHECAYPTTEVIVVDNASSDNTVEQVRRYFPMVEIVALSRNTGTAGRNEYIQRANGTYIFCLDDDSLPGSSHSFKEITEWMEAHPSISLLSTRCVQPRTGIDETTNFEIMGTKDSRQEFYCGLYAFECACCMRTEHIRAVGGYSQRDNWGAEGMDLAMKLYMHGFNSVWHPEFLTLHFKQFHNRPKQSGALGAVHHRIEFFATYFSLPFLVPIIIAYTSRRFLECLLHPRRIPDIVRGYARGIASIPRARGTSTKLSFRKAWALGRWYLGIFRW